MDRQRLTITLKQDILDRLDATIDGASIRNRSHAIEYYLGKALGSSIKTAVVLAGGQGMKMRPFTYETPKAMIPVQGKPILEHTVIMLRDAGVKKIIIQIGHLGNKIEEHFGDGSRLGISISYVREVKAEGTAAALRLAKKELQAGPFILMYGDVLIDINLLDFIDFHSESNSLATIAVTSVAKPSEFGVVRMQGSKVVEFLQKPPQSQGMSHLIYTGVSIIEPEVISLIPDKGESHLEEDVFPRLAKQKKLSGYPFEGKWFDIGTPEDYERALANWPKS
ncbi:MAG: sugar phosphate nucleotidyltransferase [bacterium]